MTPAYEEMYLNDAMRVMGEMLDYAVHDCGCDGDLFFTQFLASGVAEQFERGNPKFVGGMSGVELALEVFRRTTGQIPDVDASAYGEKSPEYWAEMCIRDSARFARAAQQAASSLKNACIFEKKKWARARKIFSCHRRPMPL